MLLVWRNISHSRLFVKYRKNELPLVCVATNVASTTQFQNRRKAMKATDRIARKNDKPRVHISCDLQVGTAVVKRELPFVMGVMGDFSGNPTTRPAPLAKRNFVHIDRDNFDDVMAKITPELDIRVRNSLQGGGSEMGVQLKFKSMDDFEPGRIVDQVPALKSLADARNKLRDLLTTMDQSEDLEAMMEGVLQ
jgi:type VI secretion system protein ImpB